MSTNNLENYGTNTVVTKRILRDMREGILTIGNTGEILFINTAAIEYLNLPAKQYVGEPFGPLFVEDEKNDEFVKLVFKAIYDKQTAHSQVIRFFGATECLLKITTSYLFDDANEEKVGIVVRMEDITTLEKVRTQKNECIFLITLFVAGIGCYMFVWQTLAMFSEPPQWVMARIMEAITVIMLIIIKKKSTLSNFDLGIVTDKKNLIHSLQFAIGASVLIIALMAVAKFALCQMFPATYTGVSFFEWHMMDDITQPTYFFVAPFQEFLSKSVLLGCLLKIFDKKGWQFPLIISSILFSIFHVTYGVPMMVASAVLNYFLGILFIRQKNIWGCSILHFSIGFFATCFNFL